MRKKRAVALAIITFSTFNPSCKMKEKNEENLLYEMEKKHMIEVIEQKDNFSKLLYSNQEVVNGKKYVLIGNTTEAVVKYDTQFKENNLFDGELKKTGEPRLTANNTYAYITYENNTKLALIDTKNERVSLLDMGKAQTNISIATDGNYVYYYSKENGLNVFDKELKNYNSIDLEHVKNIEGKINEIFLNKSSRGLMFMGSNFGSIYFYKIDKKGNYNLSRLKLQFDEKIQKPRLVEYDGKYYIKPTNQDYVLEFDYEGNFIKKMDIPLIEE